MSSEVCGANGMGGIPEVRLKPSTIRPQRWSIWYCAAAAVVHAGQLQAASSGTAVPGSRRIPGACSLDISNTTTACSRSLFSGLRILRGGADANTTRLMPYEQEIRSGEEYPGSRLSIFCRPLHCSARLCHSSLCFITPPFLLLCLFLFHYLCIIPRSVK